MSTVILAFWQLPDNNLHIIACDVGQGDAILITYKNYQILNDGGPNNKVLSCLSKYMPFWDRTIEMVILSHPQKDHYQGLIDVFKRYKVENYLYNDFKVSSPEYQVLEKEVGSSGARLLNPDIGRVIRLGMISLDIVNPSQGLISTETNDYSITYLLSYINFKAIFTGDLSPKVSNELAGNWPFGPVDYIKVPHHGSKVGLTENLLKAIMPKYAVISVGKDNIYGHPNQEILDMLTKYGVMIFRTDQIGDVRLNTNGSEIWMSDWKNP